MFISAGMRSSAVSCEAACVHEEAVKWIADVRFAASQGRREAMKLRSAVSIVIGMVMALGLMMPVHAVSSTSQSTTVTTTVPASHAVKVSCQGEGSVQVKGERYASYTFLAPRLEPLTIQVAPNPGYKVGTVTTRFGFTITGNKIILDPVCADGSVEVSFKSVPETQSQKRPSVDRQKKDEATDEKRDEGLPEMPTELTEDDADGATTASTEDDTDSTSVASAGDGADRETNTATEKDTGTRTRSRRAARQNTAQVVPLSGDGGEVELTVDYESDKNEVTLKTNEEAVEKLIEEQVSDRVSLDLSQATQTQPKIALPRKMIQMLGKKTGFELIMDNAQVYFDKDALKSIANQSEGDKIMLEVLNIESASLSDVQRQAVVNVQERIAITVHITDSMGNVIHDFGDGTATITLPYEPVEYEDTSTIEVWYLPPEGEKEQIPCEYVDGQVVFAVDHFSEYVVIAGAIRSPSDAADEGSLSSLPIAWILLGAAVLLWIFFILWKRRKKEDEEKPDGM